MREAWKQTLTLTQPHAHITDCNIYTSSACEVWISLKSSANPLDATWSLLSKAGSCSKHLTTALINWSTSQHPRSTVVRSTSKGSLSSLSATSGVWWRSSHSKAPRSSGDLQPASLCFLKRDWRDSWRPYSLYSLVPKDDRTPCHSSAAATAERDALRRAAFSVLLCYA